MVLSRQVNVPIPSPQSAKGPADRPSGLASEAKIGEAGNVGNVGNVRDVGLSADLRGRLERCSSLPTLPAIALRVLQLCQSENLDLKEIADTIGKDPALSAKVLRLVNSPVFGLRQEIRTVAHALALLGLNAVRTLALSFSLVRDLKKSQSAGLDAYWRRSIFSAVAARQLATAVRFPAPEEAFLAALLQDIGILALGRVAGREYETVAAQAGASHVCLAAVESEIFGADHADVGAWLIGSWHLPEPIRHAVAFSHRPVADLLAAKLHADITQIAKIVRLSGIIADVWACGDPVFAAETLKGEALATMGLSVEHLEPVLARVAAAVPQMATLFEIQLGSAEDISAVLEQATETLVLVSLRASRQVDSAHEALSSLEQKARVLEEASVRDKLTGLYNRARLDPYLEQEFETARTSGKPLSVIMADVDHFKKVNDTFGHSMGDQVLTAVAKILGARLRPRDLVARYGGEEFALVLPETDAAGAAVVAERIRQRIEQTPHSAASGPGLLVTMSFGCATLVPGAYFSPADLLKAADEELYKAKNAGRNRVVTT